jgi:hypothetical protein
MTRKHFQAIADVIKEIPSDRVLHKAMEFPVPEGDTRVLVDTMPMRIEVAGMMAGILKDQNDRFDYHTFFEACGVEHDKAVRYVG